MTRHSKQPNADHVITLPTCAETARVTGPLAGGTGDPPPASLLQTAGGPPPTALGTATHGTTHRPQKFNRIYWPSVAVWGAACAAYAATIAAAAHWWLM